MGVIFFPEFAVGLTGILNNQANTIPFPFYSFLGLHLLAEKCTLPCPEFLQLSVRNCFIRGSVVRYVQLPPEGVDIELLHDATRREARGG